MNMFFLILTCINPGVCYVKNGLKHVQNYYNGL